MSEDRTHCGQQFSRSRHRSRSPRTHCLAANQGQRPHLLRSFAMQASRRGTDRANTRLFSRGPLPPVRTKKRRVLRLEPLEERTLLSTYNIGPGQPYTTLGSFPWSSLGPGDTVDIHWQSTPYREKLMISESGTASQPINIVGVPGPSGQLPIIDGQNATTSSQFDYSYDPMQEDSLILIYHSADQPSTYTPSYINISGLELEGAYSGTNDGGPYTFTDSHGNVQQWSDFAAAIYMNGVQNITIQNCVIQNNGLGIFANSNTNNGGNLSSNILIQGNSIYDNGVVGQEGKHNVYCEVNGITYQYNDFGPPRAGASADSLKDRSSGCIIRYNTFTDSSSAYMLDLVDAEDSSEIESQPSYATTYVYGNTFINSGADENVRLFHLGQDGGTSPRLNMDFYDNTVIDLADTDVGGSGTALFYMDSATGHVFAANNLFYNANSVWMAFSIQYGNITFSPTNWVSPGWYPSTASVNGQTYTGTITGTNTFFVDPNNNPGFVNLSGGDYHLASGSNAIGIAGSLNPSWPAVTEQYEAPTSGTARTSVADLGAYQAGPETPTVTSETPTVTSETPASAATNVAAAPSATSETPASGATNVAVSTAPTATFNEAVQSSTISFTLQNSSRSSVAATVTYNSSNDTATLTPSAALAYSTTYTATLSGAKDQAGNTMSPVSWSFTTAAAPPPTPTSFTIGDTTIESTNDSGNGNLLVVQKATLSQAATIQSLSFYVNALGGNLRLGLYADNAGSPGALIASTNEFTPTSTGWNTQNVVTPVSLTAGTYWLAYLPQSNSLGFEVSNNGSGTARWINFNYGPLPATFPSGG